jgi:hypothetical protein
MLISCYRHNRLTVQLKGNRGNFLSGLRWGLGEFCFAFPGVGFAFALAIGSCPVGAFKWETLILGGFDFGDGFYICAMLRPAPHQLRILSKWSRHAAIAVFDLDSSGV